MITAPGKRPSFAPANWGGWVLVGVLWLIGKMPFRLGLWLSVPLGGLLYHLMGRRREVAFRNVSRCFPELNREQTKKLVKANFRSLARTVFETAWCWGMSRRRFMRKVRVEGQARLLDAEEAGKGVLLTTAHMTCMEVGGRVSCEMAPVTGVYRPLSNPVLEWYQNRGRLAYAHGMISKREMRTSIRYLRNGGILWYAPDQDFGPSRSVFVPFFGIQTATLEATHKLVMLTGCAVVPMFPSFDPETRTYVLRVLPALEGFPGGDVHTDLARLNAEMENHVRSVPEQYWWIHRRFKTRPEGESSFYD
jgi:KDO2-lipid IV(A) lauroyltransferase